MGDTTYMSVFGGGTEMATFATDQTSISIYWGSIDPGNGFTAVTINGYTLTGAQLGMMGATDDGNQLSPTSNELVTISGLGASGRRSSPRSTNAFEFSLGANLPGLPSRRPG